LASRSTMWVNRWLSWAWSYFDKAVIILCEGINTMVFSCHNLENYLTLPGTAMEELAHGWLLAEAS
jgi:hypothetical protein